MELHQLRKFKTRARTRRGRGGKRGTYSGRGLKGQKSRAGRKMRPAERDLILRLPKRRGFSNKTKSDKPLIFNLRELEFKLKISADSKTPIVLNKDFLKELELLPLSYRGKIKILGDGTVNIPIKVEGLEVSAGARNKIQKAGGSVQ